MNTMQPNLSLTRIQNSNFFLWTSFYESNVSKKSWADDKRGDPKQEANKVGEAATQYHDASLLTQSTVDIKFKEADSNLGELDDFKVECLKPS